MQIPQELGASILPRKPVLISPEFQSGEPWTQEAFHGGVSVIAAPPQRGHAGRGCKVAWEEPGVDGSNG